MSEQAVQHALDVKRRHEAALLRLPNVVAVGVGFRTRAGQPTAETCIVVSVSRKVPAAQLTRQQLIPVELEGTPVDVVETGTIHAL
jgi:hypothetical protein